MTSFLCQSYVTRTTDKRQTTSFVWRWSEYVLALYNFLFLGFFIINRANICSIQIIIFLYLEIYKKYADNNAGTNAYTEFEIFSFS